MSDNPTCPCCTQPVASPQEAERLRALMDRAFDTILQGFTWCRDCGGIVSDDDRRSWPRPTCEECQPVEAAVREDLAARPQGLRPSPLAMLALALDGRLSAPQTQEVLANTAVARALRNSRASLEQHFEILDQAKARLRQTWAGRAAADQIRSGGVLEHDHLSQPQRPVDRHAFPEDEK